MISLCGNSAGTGHESRGETETGPSTATHATPSTGGIEVTPLIAAIWPEDERLVRLLFEWRQAKKRIGGGGKVGKDSVKSCSRRNVQSEGFIGPARHSIGWIYIWKNREKSLLQMGLQPYPSQVKVEGNMGSRLYATQHTENRVYGQACAW